MNAPVGAPNTWPVPLASTRGASIRPKLTSLVPSDTAIRPSRTRPVPIRLHGLSPDHVTTRARRKSVALLPVRRQRAGHRIRRPNRRQLRCQARCSGRDGWLPPVARRQVHQVHAGTVARIERRMRADQQRRHERAHQVHAIGRGVAPGSVFENFRICGPVKRSNARDPVCALSGPAPPTAAVISRHSAPVLESIQIGDACARQHRCDLLGQRPRGIQRSEARRGAAVQVHAPVLLRRPGDRRDSPEVDAALREPAEHHVQRLGPHHRRRHRLIRMSTRQHAVPGPVMRQRRIEAQRLCEHDLARVAVDDDGGQALGAGIEAEVQRHGKYQE